MELLKTKRILLAEDEKMLAEILHFELSAHGPQVSIARDGAEAIEKIHEIKPDLLLLDLLMPKKSGFDVLQYLRENELDIPIVMLSNISDPHEQKKCLDLGALTFLVKSQIDPEDLWGKIQGYLTN